MAKLKMLKYPKKPKQSASVVTLERYIERCKEIDKENAKRKAQNAKRETLKKRVAGIKQKV
ncbi:MAG: hypothetical protein RBT49_09550 [Bacteroidales bacterium]|jgi:hypothetical protein|nr:hypothetical protein [Bacteroidales bacterium]